MTKVNFQLKSLRAKRGLSQHSVAKFLGITASSYNRKENGIRKFTVDEAGKISEIFGIGIEEIFFAETVTKVITRCD